MDGTEEQKIKEIDRLLNHLDHDVDDTSSYLDLSGLCNDRSILLGYLNSSTKRNIFRILRSGALELGSYEIVLQHIKDHINDQDNNGNTLLHTIINDYYFPRVIEYIDLLIKYGSRVDIRNHSLNQPVHHYMLIWKQKDDFYKRYPDLKTKYKFIIDNDYMIKNQIITRLHNVMKKQQLLFDTMLRWFEQYIMACVFGLVKEDEFTLHDDYHPDSFSQDKEQI